jgi:hypothetical protein
MKNIWWSGLFCIVCALIPLTARSATIGSVNVTNTSSPDDASPPRQFQTLSTLSPVTNTPTSSSFTHRMAFYNRHVGVGGVAQVNKRDVIYQIDFTVNDPANVGFELTATSFLRGISSITQTSSGGGIAATATGASFFVSIDDSTDPPDTYITLVPLFNTTTGVSVSGMGTSASEEQSTESASLGSFVGTTSFSLRFSTLPTPTTNVFFDNGQTGFGEADYGLGSLAPVFLVDPTDLGHFVTITASFIPEPSCMAILLLGFACSAMTVRRFKRPQAPTTAAQQPGKRAGCRISRDVAPEFVSAND